MVSTCEKLIKLDGGSPLWGVQPAKNSLSANDGNPNEVRFSTEPYPPKSI